MRAFTTAAIRRMQLSQDRMAHALEIQAEIARHGLRCVERPVRVHYTSYSLAKGQRSMDAIEHPLGPAAHSPEIAIMIGSQIALLALLVMFAFYIVPSAQHGDGSPDIPRLGLGGGGLILNTEWTNIIAKWLGIGRGARPDVLLLHRLLPVRFRHHRRDAATDPAWPLHPPTGGTG